LSHPSDDREIIDEIKNALAHTTFSTGLIVHVDAHSGNLSFALLKEMRAMMHQTQHTVTSSDSLLRGNQSFAAGLETRFAINPFRISVTRFQGSILLGHLTNFMAAKALGWDPQFYLMMPSNCRFVQCGVEVHIAQVQLSFGKYEVCHQIHPPRNAKGAKAYTTAVVLGPLAQYKPNCWAMCSNNGGGDNPGSVVALLATLFGLLPWRNATHDSGEEYNAASAVDWVHQVLLPKHTVVVQRHEGAFFPSIVLESLAEFLADTQVYFAENFSGRSNSSSSSSSSSSSEPLHNSKGLGLRTLHEAAVAAEEFVLSTWVINKFPELVPGEKNDKKIRDITTFLISGRSTEATSKDIRDARKHGYYSAKRLIFSTKATSDVRGISCRTPFLILSAIHQQPTITCPFSFDPPPHTPQTPTLQADPLSAQFLPSDNSSMTYGKSLMCTSPILQLTRKHYQQSLTLPLGGGLVAPQWMLQTFPTPIPAFKNPQFSLANAGAACFLTTKHQSGWTGPQSRAYVGMCR
jgi:hypothetical protein